MHSFFKCHTSKIINFKRFLFYCAYIFSVLILINFYIKMDINDAIKDCQDHLYKGFVSKSSSGINWLNVC